VCPFIEGRQLIQWTRYPWRCVWAVGRQVWLNSCLCCWWTQLNRFNRRRNCGRFVVVHDEGVGERRIRSGDDCGNRVIRVIRSCAQRSLGLIDNRRRLATAYDAALDFIPFSEIGPIEGWRRFSSIWSMEESIQYVCNSIMLTVGCYRFRWAVSASSGKSMCVQYERKFLRREKKTHFNETGDFGGFFLQRRLKVVVYPKLIGDMCKEKILL